MISYKKFSGYSPALYRADFKRLANLNMFAEIILTHCWSPIVWTGNYAKTENFEFSDFLALDFDTPGEETLEEINHSLRDHRRIIATTKSHQKIKNGVTCDRFRLIIPWDKRLTSYDDYKFNYKKVLERFPWADKQCSDGARFFFPSQKIVYIDRESSYAWETSAALYTKTTHTPHHINAAGVIPNWALNFLNNGAVYCGSRNQKVHAVARALFDAGFDETSVRNLILRAPINWDGVGVEACIKSARGKSTWVKNLK